MLNFYIFMYVLNLICLVYLIKTTFENKITLTSIPHMLMYIEQFSKYKYLYYSLFLALTGIPPFLLFFIKFNYLIASLSNLTFVIIYIIFLIFFLNMLYYVQVYITKDTKLDMTYLKIKKSRPDYKTLYWINFIVSLFYLSVCFFPDMYFVNFLTGVR